MKFYRLLRLGIGLLTGFIALTSIGGGVALLAGLEDARIPLEWLNGTPIADYKMVAYSSGSISA